MKKVKKPHKHYTGGKKGDTAELSARLAPLEEKQSAVAQQPTSKGGKDNNGGSGDGGAIIVNTSQVALSSDFIEEDRAAEKFFRLEPVALVIVLLSLAFILFIAWQITLMPSK